MLKTLATCGTLLLALVCGQARAGLDPNLLTDLHHDIWTSKEGAPTDINAMAQSADGWLWLSTPNGLYRFDGVRFERFRPRPGQALLDARLANLYAAPNGDLWIGYAGGAGVSVLRQGQLTHHTPAQPALGTMHQALQDPDGSLWLASSTGLLHFVRGAWERIGAAQGLPTGVVTHVFVDRQRRVWVTSSGRVFVRNRPGAPFVRPFPDETNGGFTTASDGRTWIGTAAGMRLLDDPLAGAAPPSRPERGAANSAPFLFDNAGNFWTRNDDSTLHFIRADEVQGKSAFAHEATPREILSVEQQKRGRPEAFLRDMEGNIWVAVAGGIDRYRPQRVHCLTMDQKYSRFGLANDGTEAMWVDARPAGDLWRVGAGGLMQVKGETRSLAQLGFADLQAAPARGNGKDVVFDADGMAVRIGDRFHRLRTNPPALLANAQAIVASANGDRWINTYAGLVHIRAADWQGWLARPDSVVDTALFDDSDGYPGAQGGQHSLMATTNNGRRVWFVGKRGLAWVDSETIVRNPVPPRAEVVQLHAGASEHAGNGVARLAAGTTNIGIDFTALSFTMPERLRFKYRLVGLDDAWHEAETRRSAGYTNLGPGAYRFEVLAANEDGVWGTEPATLPFSIAPLFTQTWWFFGLCALALVGALALLHRARVRTVRKHLDDRLHERLYERERIARSLHDTYLQSVQGLIYVFHDVAQRLPVTAAEYPALDRALAIADDVLIQGREQVLDLRTPAPGTATLAHSLGEFGKALAAHAGMTCDISTTGTVRPMRGHVFEELLSIGREALCNAFRHARGTRVDLALRFEADQFTMCIEDDGIGWPVDVRAHGNRAGHWGLPGMRERADTLHGTLAIDHGPAGGARIVLTVPARIAYIDRQPAWQALVRWWQRTIRPGAGAPGPGGQG